MYWIQIHPSFCTKSSNLPTRSNLTLYKPVHYPQILLKIFLDNSSKSPTPEGNQLMKLCCWKLFANKFCAYLHNFRTCVINAHVFLFHV